MIIIAEYETSNCAFFCTFNFTFILQYIGTLYCIGSLTLSIVSSIMFLFFIFYASSFLILLILLWSLLKCLLLLKFLIQPLFPRLLVLLLLKSLISWLLQLSFIVFFYFTKVYWFYAVLWFLYLLWCFVHRCCFNTSFTSFFLLVDPIIYFDGLINKSFYIFCIFY